MAPGRTPPLMDGLPTRTAVGADAAVIAAVDAGYPAVMEAPMSDRSGARHDNTTQKQWHQLGQEKHKWCHRHVHVIKKDKSGQNRQKLRVLISIGEGL